MRFPIVPVVYQADLLAAQALISASYAGGLRVFEFTNRGSSALATFRQLVPFVRQHCPDMALGIGTILTTAEAEEFIEAGADFIVQPIISPAIGALCQRHNLAWVPAGSTLNEIYQATHLGAALVKVFPGSVVGPGFIRAIKGPMPDLKLMVTGGVEPTISRITEWFDAGVTCVGIGSQLFGEPGASPDRIQQHITSLMAATTPYRFSQS